MATPKTGSFVWISCEVKSGPFSNERIVRVDSPGGPWVGFVDVRYLKDPVESGRTEIQAHVLSTNGKTIQISLPGHSVASSRVIEKEKTQVGSLVTVPA